jgi:hypothetical protein
LFCGTVADQFIVWQNVRGYVADLQIVDEAGFVSGAMYKSAVLPVGLNSHVTTLLATTPGKPTSFLMQAIKLIDPQTGRPIIPVLRTYQPCDYHMKTDTPWVCTCKASKRAEWKSAVRERAWQPLWGTDQDVFAAENLGIEMDFSASMFHAAWVEALRTRPRHKLSSHARYVFVGVDGAAGGEDQFAITAMVPVDHTTWLVSLLLLLF